MLLFPTMPPHPQKNIAPELPLQGKVDLAKFGNRSRQLVSNSAATVFTITSELDTSWQKPSKSRTRVRLSGIAQNVPQTFVIWSLNSSPTVSLEDSKTITPVEDNVFNFEYEFSEIGSREKSFFKKTL